MGGRTTYRINLTATEQTELERLIRQQTAPQHQVKRARVILLANVEGASNQAIAEQLGIYKAEVTNWTKRWIDRAQEPIAQRLTDLPRCGRPDTITPEQWCRIYRVF
jgi:transposase